MNFILVNYCDASGYQLMGDKNSSVIIVEVNSDIRKDLRNQSEVFLCIYYSFAVHNKLWFNSSNIICSILSASGCVGVNFTPCLINLIISFALFSI